MTPTSNVNYREVDNYVTVTNKKVFDVMSSRYAKLRIKASKTIEK